MAGENKPEFQPLFAPGRHRMTLGEVVRRCVDPFPTSATRPALATALGALVTELETAGVPCEIWCDGSFISAKDNPEDVDLCIVIEGEAVDALDPGTVTAVEGMPARYAPALHVFPIVTRPLGHPYHDLLSEAARSWSEWWCVARGGWLKGIPVLRLGETDVGLRLLP